MKTNVLTSGYAPAKASTYLQVMNRLTTVKARVTAQVKMDFSPFPLPNPESFPIFAVLNILNRASDRRPLCRWLFLCQQVDSYDILRYKVPTPVWCVNAPTALFKVFSNGKAEPSFLFPLYPPSLIYCFI